MGLIEFLKRLYGVCDTESLVWEVLISSVTVSKPVLMFKKNPSIFVKINFKIIHRRISNSWCKQDLSSLVFDIGLLKRRNNKSVRKQAEVILAIPLQEPTIIRKKCYYLDSYRILQCTVKSKPPRQNMNISDQYEDIVIVGIYSYGPRQAN